MRKERSFDIFMISERAVLGLIIAALLFPSLAVPALFLVPVAAFVAVLGMCAEQTEQSNKQATK